MYVGVICMFMYVCVLRLYILCMHVLCVYICNICLVIVYLSLLINVLSRECLYSLVKQIFLVLCWTTACEANRSRYAVTNWLSVSDRDLNWTKTYIRLNCLLVYSGVESGTLV